MQIDLEKYNRSSGTSKKKPTRTQRNFSELFHRDIPFGNRTLTDKKKERFYSELHLLFESGVAIKTALELICNAQRNKKGADLFTKISEEVISGSGFSQALEKSGRFSTYEVQSIRIGEESGNITPVLEELMLFYQRKIKLKRQFLSALAYPAFVFLVTIGVVWFMLVYVVPMFSDVFLRFGGELPALTQFVVDLSNAFTAYFKYGVLAAVLIIILLYTQRKATWFRKTSARVVLQIPLIGPIIQLVFLSRLCQSMHLLIASNTPLVRAIDLVQQMVSWYPAEQALRQVKADLVRGIPLNKSFGQFPDHIFPSRMIALIKVAEEVNQLDHMFQRLARQYSDEVEHRTGITGSLLEPVMILFIAGVVGIILVAMYQPLFDLSTKIG